MNQTEINEKLKNYTIDQIEEYLDTIGYSLLKTSELESLENIAQNHPG